MLSRIHKSFQNNNDMISLLKCLPLLFLFFQALWHYTFMYKNMPTALPSLRMVQRIALINTAVLKKVNLDLMSYSSTLSHNGVPKVVSVGENATRVIGRVEYDNQKSTSKQILNGCALCDMHVNVFQNLVKMWFPNIGGLQNTLLQMNYSIDHSAKPILQILHIRNSHWATLYVDSEDICVYDSAYASLSEDTWTVITQLIRCSRKSIEVKVMNIAKQSGSVDCALYCMAMVLNLALGNSARFAPTSRAMFGI